MLCLQDIIAGALVGAVTGAAAGAGSGAALGGAGTNGLAGNLVIRSCFVHLCANFVLVLFARGLQGGSVVKTLWWLKLVSCSSNFKGEYKSLSNFYLCKIASAVLLKTLLLLHRCDCLRSLPVGQP